MRQRTTVGVRLWTVFALCLGVGASAACVLIQEFRATFASSTVDLQARSRQQDAARVMQVTFKKEVQEWKDTLLRGHNASDLRKYSGQFQAASARVKELGSSLKASLSDPEARNAVDAFLQAHSTLGGKYEAALGAFMEAHGENAHQVDAMVKGQDRTATDLIDKVVDVSQESARAAAQAQQGAAVRRIWAISLMALLALGAIGVIAAFIIRGVTRTLRSAIQELGESAEQLSGAAHQVSSASQNLARGSSEQAGPLEESSAATSEINSMAHRNTENSQQAAKLMALSRSRFDEAEQYLNQMVGAMGEINAQSDKIARIIKVIDEIAFQTNILALNAAVQAARAGEAGMGFAVVADEVRGLAQRSAQAAKDTSELIQESIAKSNNGKVKMDQVAVVIRAIAQESGDIKTLVDEVSNGSQEQTRGIEQIAQATAQMERVTQQSAASSEETASAAQELSAQSETLQAVVGRLAEMVDGAGAR